MRGSPVLRSLGILAALLLLLIPIRCITAPRPVAPPAPMPQVESEEVRLTVTSSRVPFTFSVSHLGHVIWSGKSNAPSAEKSVSLPFPPEGIDLVLDAEWEAKEPAAIKLEVRCNHHEAASQTIWGEGAASDVLTFH